MRFECSRMQWQRRVDLRLRLAHVERACRVHEPDMQRRRLRGGVRSRPDQLFEQRRPIL